MSKKLKVLITRATFIDGEAVAPGEKGPVVKTVDEDSARSIIAGGKGELFKPKGKADSSDG